MVTIDPGLFSIERPKLDCYRAFAHPNLIVESYRSASGHMKSGGSLHRISLNRTGHRSYAYRYGRDAYRQVERPAWVVGVQPADTTLEVEGDDADYLSVFQPPRLYDEIKGSPVCFEAMSQGTLSVRADAMTVRMALCLFELAADVAVDTLTAEHIGTAFACSVIRLLGAAPVVVGPVLSPERLRRVRDYIDDALDQPSLTVGELAGVAELSPFHFSRAFKAATGTAPHQYVLRRRVGHAEALLADGRETLADIAYASGFSSQAHLSHAFKRVVGVTPGEYRRTSTPSRSAVGRTITQRRRTKPE